MKTQTFPIRQGGLYKNPATLGYTRQKVKRIIRELVQAGATPYGLMKSESRYLPKILHDDEHIEAVVYGQHQDSSAMLVATDERIIYLDKKPMVTLFDEVSYEVISGIQFDIHLLFATVVLHTPVKNYDIRFANIRCGEKFARYIETQRLEREKIEEEEEPEEKKLPIPPPDQPDIAYQHPNELKENMAGYYWLPTDEEERKKAQEGII